MKWITESFIEPQMGHHEQKLTLKYRPETQTKGHTPRAVGCIQTKSGSITKKKGLSILAVAV